jgi:hypothetical protein
MTIDREVGGTAIAPDFRHADPGPVRLGIGFSVIAVALTFPDVWRLRSSVAGNSGDSLLNLWIMRSVQIGLPHGWHGFWNAGIFYPERSTLAYSDTLLPVALVHGVLRIVLGNALAFNLIYLGSWVVSSWCVYLLARRVAVHWGAAFVAALAFTYSTIRLAHHGHFQLVVGGALVPLVVLSLIRLLEQPTPWRGIALGSAFSALALTASYYGAMMAVIVVVVVGGWWLLARGSGNDRARLTALACAAAVVLVLGAPIAAKYVRLQESAHFRRPFESSTAAHLSDFLATSDSSYVVGHLPVIGSSSGKARGIENRLFPGFIAFGFGAAGLVIVVREARGRGWRTGRARKLLVLAIAGAVVTILAFGDWFVIAGHRIWLPFALFRHTVPGFAGIRAESRLAIGGELALALFAAVAIDAVIARCRGRRAREALVYLLALAVLVEGVMGIQFVRVPTSRDDGGVSRTLERLPHGPVLELPIRTAATGGAAWAYVETPRQLVAIDDGDPRVNGYSGYQPPAFEEHAHILNQFPAPAAIAEAKQLGVRYVVLRTALVGPVTPAYLTEQLNADGIGRYTDGTAAQLAARLTPATASLVEKLSGGYVIALH